MSIWNLINYFSCYSRIRQGNNANMLKKAALNITTKFGLVNTHRALVVTISEERHVYETLLKLVLARVNGKFYLIAFRPFSHDHVVKYTKAVV